MRGYYCGVRGGGIYILGQVQQAGQGAGVRLERDAGDLDVVERGVERLGKDAAQQDQRHSDG